MKTQSEISETEIYQFLVDSSNDWLEWTDTDCKVQYVSPACETISGYRPEEFVANPQLIEAITHADDREKMLKHRHVPPSTQGESRELVFRIWNKDGSIRYLQHNCQPIYHSAGRLLGIRASYRDVTMQKKAEEALVRNEAILQMLVDNPMDVATVTDASGTVLFCNNSFSDRLGKPKEHIIGTNIWTNFPPKVAEFRKAVFDRVIQSGKSERLEDKQPGRIYDSIVNPVIDRDGQVSMVTILARDITERKQAEVELRQAKELLEIILNGVGDGIQAWDNAGRLVFVNQETFWLHKLASQSSNLSYDYLMANFELFDESGELIPRERYPSKLAWEGKSSQTGIIRIRHLSSNEERWSIIKAKPIMNEDQAVKMVVLISHDVTSLKDAQHELEEARQELEERIVERTKELTQTNQELRAEIALREQFEKALQSQRIFVDSILQTAQVIILVLDEAGKISYINPYLEEISGYRLDDLRGKDWFETLLPERDRQTLRKIFDETRDNLYTFGSINPIITANQEERHIEWYSKTIRDPHQNPIGILAIGQDVTVRLQTEENLRRNTARSEALARVASRLSQRLELQAVLNTICEEIIRTIPSMPVTSVMLFVEETDSLNIAASHGLTEEYLQQATPLPRAYYEEMLTRFGPVIIVPDVRTLPEMHDSRLNTELQARTTVNIPLKDKDELIGCLNASSLHEIYLPTEEEIHLIEALANHAVVAISNARLFEQVSSSHASLQSLSEKLVEIQEEERRELARELHDEIGQALTSLHLTLDMMGHQSETEPRSTYKLRKEAHQVQDMVGQLLKQVRDLSLDLRPALLDDLGLLPALLAHFERYTTLTNVKVDFKHSGLEKRFLPKIETTAFRIVQEALNNAAKYAGVEVIQVRVWANEQSLSLLIEDSGKGFDLRSIKNRGTTLGLSSMRERATLCGGSLEIETQPGSGTSLTVELPLLHSQMV